MQLDTSSFFTYLVLFFIGFVNALPIPLIGSILSIWLIEEGFSKATIGSFALLGIPFSFKLLWTPIVDHVSFPSLSKKRVISEAQRKAWLFFSVTGIALSFYSLSLIAPSQNPYCLAFILVAISLFKGCLYIVGLSYELESLDEDSYGIGSSCVITGYRIGLLVAGAGGLYLSAVWGWSFCFKSMAMLVSLVSLLILLQKEPFKSKEIIKNKRLKLSLYPSLFRGFVFENIILPCRLFFKKSNWVTILFLLLFFKIGDHATKSMSGPFYLSLGFTKIELASAAKVCGMAATLVGSALGGYVLRGKDPFSSLGKFGFIHACSLICHSILSFGPKSLVALYFTVALENFTGGLAITAFIYFLWRVCDKQYAAVQYAILWSLFSLKSHFFAFLGGVLASLYPWTIFFPIVTSIGLVSAISAWRLASQHLRTKAIPAK